MLSLHQQTAGLRSIGLVSTSNKTWQQHIPFELDIYLELVTFLQLCLYNTGRTWGYNPQQRESNAFKHIWWNFTQSQGKQFSNTTATRQSRRRPTAKTFVLRLLSLPSECTQTRRLTNPCPRGVQRRTLLTLHAARPPEEWRAQML